MSNNEKRSKLQLNKSGFLFWKDETRFCVRLTQLSELFRHLLLSYHRQSFGANWLTCLKSVVKFFSSSLCLVNNFKCFKKFRRFIKLVCDTRVAWLGHQKPLHKKVYGWSHLIGLFVADSWCIIDSFKEQEPTASMTITTSFPPFTQIVCREWIQNDAFGLFLFDMRVCVWVGNAI